MIKEEYNRINSTSHLEVKKILLESNFGQQNRYRFTDLKNITIVSDITPVILKKDIYSRFSFTLSIIDIPVSCLYLKSVKISI